MVRDPFTGSAATLPGGVDILTPDDLGQLLAPLRRDYAATIAAAAARPAAERAALIGGRVAAYSEAFAAALGGALDDATGVR